MDLKERRECEKEENGDKKTDQWKSSGRNNWVFDSLIIIDIVDNRYIS